ncbi:MAG TPA: hypothetical protein VG452_10615 [Egibacteraceae bacterium]|nr:hypothetical protein [Egibacteraceae bacterium]
MTQQLDDVRVVAHGARRQALLLLGQERDEYVNLLRWRLEQDLGYQRTHPLLIRNERGGPLDHMVFATDNPAGDRIMSYLYGQAASQFEAMRDEALQRRSGQPRLFPVEIADQQLYRYEPPWQPDS